MINRPLDAQSISVPPSIFVSKISAVSTDLINAGYFSGTDETAGINPHCYPPGIRSRHVLSTRPSQAEENNSFDTRPMIVVPVYKLSDRTFRVTSTACMH